MASRFFQLDNRIEIVTPENIGFAYRVAGPFWRLPAYLIDLVVRGIIFLVISLAAVWGLGMFGMSSVGWMFTLLAWFVLSWFYGGLFETYWNGQTPGKRMMRLRVVSLDGEPIDALQAVLRNVLRAADALPIATYQVGLLAASMNDRFQRLGDLACGTMVVIEESNRRVGGVARVDEPAVAALAAQLGEVDSPSRGLARALSRYVERRRYFAPGRRAEIARHLGRPLVEKYALPPDTSHDLLLCALYTRAFFGTEIDEPVAAAVIDDSPRIEEFATIG